MKKIMSLWDIVFMNVTAIIGLRWLPIAAGYGASSIVLWFLAAMLFFIPLGLVSTELATTWPDEGGMYVWVKEAFGEKCGFFVSWFYWVNSFFYCPALLTFAAVALAFIFDPPLAKNRYFICAVVLASLWGVTWLNFTSMRLVKFVSNLGGAFGTLLPGFAIIFLGFAAVFILKRPIATNYSLSHWIPHLSHGSNIAFLVTLMFSMAGIELTPILAGETKDPQKTFPRATLISAFFIVGIYVVGTMAITFILKPSEISAASGLMAALALITHELHLQYVMAAILFMIVVGQFGGASVWVVAPIRMLFESTKQGVLPKFFTKLNKNDMPKNAIIVQAIGVSLVTVTTLFLPSVNVFYEIIVLMAAILYFIPYLFMFMTFLRLRKLFPEKVRPYKVPGGKWFAWLITIFGLGSVLAAMVLPFIVPPADVKTASDVLQYRIELIMGPIFFAISAYWIYWRFERRSQRGLKIKN